MPTTQSNRSPLISFIIAAYNLPTDLLHECIQSITTLSLSAEEREIIVIDDGSDQCALDELEDVREELLYLRQPNAGLSAARNMGLRLAQGKYIQFVDGDDYLLRAPYEQCLDVVRFGECDMVLFYETEKATSELTFDVEGPVSGVHYMHNNNLRASACGYIFRRSMLGSLRFTPGILHEDEEFTPQLMLRAEKVYSTKSEAYFYRRREGSIMTDESPRHKAKRLDDTFSIILNLQQVAQSGPEMDRVALQRRIAQLSMDYLYNTIRLTHSYRHLMEAIGRLRDNGLYPLPDKPYTKSYTTFRRMVNNPIGRRLLMVIVRSKN